MGIHFSKIQINERQPLHAGNSFVNAGLAISNIAEKLTYQRFIHITSPYLFVRVFYPPIKP
jgi:hypothetical protein